MKSQEIQSLLALGPEAQSKQQRGSYLHRALVWHGGHTPPPREPPPHITSVGSGLREEIGPGLSRKGWSALIWEEPGVFLINRGAWEPGVHIQEVAGAGQWRYLSFSPFSQSLSLSGSFSSSPFLLVFPLARVSILSPGRGTFTLHLGECLYLSPLCSCSQLERSSGTWAGSSLRRTFSFLLSMTGKTKVGVRQGSRRSGDHCLSCPLSPHPIVLSLPQLPL